MQEINEKIQYILDSGVSNLKKVDALLELDADNIDLGKGASKSSIALSRKNSRTIYKAIKKVDKATGELLINHLDR